MAFLFFAPPCQDDIASRGETFALKGADWKLKTSDDYFGACNKCQITVALETEEQRKSLVRSLSYQQPSKGIGGRMMIEDLEVAGAKLKKNDRLQPSSGLQDISMLDTIPLPVTIEMWRPNLSASGTLNDAVSFKSPMFDESIFSTPATTLAIDALHTLALGVQMKFINAGLWRLHLSNPFGYTGTLDKILALTAEQVKSDLQKFQDEHNVDRKRRLDTFTVKMLGKRKKKNLQDCLFLFCRGSWGTERRDRQTDRQTQQRSPLDRPKEEKRDSM